MNNLSCVKFLLPVHGMNNIKMSISVASVSTHLTTYYWT